MKFCITRGRQLFIVVTESSWRQGAFIQQNSQSDRGCNVFSAEAHRKSDLDLLSHALKCSVLYELRYEIWRSNASFSGSKWIDHLMLPRAGMAILWRSFNQVNTRRGGILIGPCDPTMCEGTIATTLFDMLITPFDSLLRVKARL